MSKKNNYLGIKPIFTYSEEQKKKIVKFQQDGCNEFVARLFKACIDYGKETPAFMTFYFPGIGKVSVDYMGKWGGVDTIRVYDEQKEHGYPKPLYQFINEDGSVDGVGFVTELFREFNWTTKHLEEDED